MPPVTRVNLNAGRANENLTLNCTAVARVKLAGTSTFQASAVALDRKCVLCGSSQAAHHALFSCVEGLEFTPRCVNFCDAVNDLSSACDRRIHRGSPAISISNVSHNWINHPGNEGEHDKDDCSKTRMRVSV